MKPTKAIFSLAAFFVLLPGITLPAVESSPDNQRSNKFKHLAIRVGYLQGFTENSESFTLNKDIYFEQGSFQVDSLAKKGKAFEAALGYQFTKSLGLELGGSHSTRTINADGQASIPHPLWNDRPRTSDLSQQSFTLTENVVFLNLIYTLRLGHFAVELSAGPCYILSTLDWFSSFDVQEAAYPYNDITVTPVISERSKNGWGAEAGAGLGYYLAGTVGIFLNAGYFYGNVTFDTVNGIAGPKITLGGFYAGGGLKIIF